MAAFTKILMMVVDRRWVLVILMYQGGAIAAQTWSTNVHRIDLTATAAMVAPAGNALIMNAFRVVRTVSQRDLSRKVSHPQGPTVTMVKNHQAKNNCSHYKTFKHHL